MAIRCLSLVGALIAALTPGPVSGASTESAAPPAPAATGTPPVTVETDEQRLRDEVAGLLEQLDSDCYVKRRGAAERLEALVQMPEHGALLAAEFHRRLRDPEVSFEVRWHLERWRGRLPAPPPEPPDRVLPEELDRVVRQLEADAYAVRLAAVRRLEWLLQGGKLVGPVAARIKARLRSPELSDAGALYLDEVWRGLRPIWSQSDPAEWDLPEVQEETIRGWVDALARAAPAGAARRAGSRFRAAERELSDLLMRDEYVPRVAAALKQRLEEPVDIASRARLEALFDETRPAMVAEYWQQGQHLAEQHLLVDVPSQSAGAVRPSHFDRIDDRTARCVSGASLSPGEYPVGVAIPHPRRSDAMFHLVNLPTPRRRVWYAQYASGDEAVRLREISRRTVAWLRRQQRRVDEDDLRLLAWLDPEEVSRFAGWYFTAVADDSLPVWEPRPDPYMPGRFLPLARPVYPGGRPSRHGGLALLLAAEGTRDAAPGLLEAIDGGRFQPPSETAPYRLDWIAAFCIAQRDPWSEVDPWLARAVPDERQLALADGPTAEVGATAAAVLVTRHGQRFAEFGLQPVGDETLTGLGLTGYRFDTPAGRRRVLRWCADAGLDPGEPKEVVSHRAVDAAGSRLHNEQAVIAKPSP